MGRKVVYLIDDKLWKGAAALMKVTSAVNHVLGEGILDLEGSGDITNEDDVACVVEANDLAA